MSHYTHSVIKYRRQIKPPTYLAIQYKLRQHIFRYCSELLVANQTTNALAHTVQAAAAHLQVLFRTARGKLNNQRPRPYSTGCGSTA
ncbi:hypothetical protein J6590_035919 [Homalodisca vitripennis]|nr:hypothetical protein J6590_035919 [Homalodisca vitripennis]